MSIQGALCLSRLSQMEFPARSPGDISGLQGGARVGSLPSPGHRLRLQDRLHPALMDSHRVGVKVWEN